MQKLASEFVCVIEETFFLYPPDWLKDPPNPASTRLFKTYAGNAPRGTWPARTTTHQGLYCMTADGDYLSGRFANPSREIARDTLASGMARWKEIASAANLTSRPVPTDKLDLYGGELLQKGGLKLEVAYRDFPRGEIERPGNSRQPNPYNLGWFDFTAQEAAAFLGSKGEKTALPDSLFKEFARRTLKDAVRGQMSDWKAGEMSEGRLFTELTGQRGSEKMYRLTGSAKFSAGERSYAPLLYGELRYDTARGEFTDFRLVASGQRTGKGGANGREADPGPAPLGIAFRLYQSHSSTEKSE